MKVEDLDILYEAIALHKENYLGLAVDESLEELKKDLKILSILKENLVLYEYEPSEENDGITDILNFKKIPIMTFFKDEQDDPELKLLKEWLENDK